MHSSVAASSPAEVAGWKRDKVMQIPRSSDGSTDRSFMIGAVVGFPFLQIVACCTVGV